MKIMCIIRRKGGSAVELPLPSGRTITYLFEPDPKDPQGPHVCEVTDPDHIGTLLGIKEGYKVASGNASVAEVDETDLLETSAGETLTLFVIKSGHVSNSTLQAMGLEVVDLSLGGPVKPEVAPTPRTVISKPKPAAKPPEPPAPSENRDEAITNDELAAEVKVVTGRAPKPGSTREDMMAILSAGK